jgi:hypothetical protein
MIENLFTPYAVAHFDLGFLLTAMAFGASSALWVNRFVEGKK